jgi:2-phospho-L-lactate transferase/gluconeogenesis factor (CofD/UPF0052 family)
VKAGVGDLAHALVGAHGLPELLLGARDVQDVIDDLEEQAQLAREGAIDGVVVGRRRWSVRSNCSTA